MSAWKEFFIRLFSKRICETVLVPVLSFKLSTVCIWVGVKMVCFFSRSDFKCVSYGTQIIPSTAGRILQPTRQIHINERHAEENHKIILFSSNVHDEMKIFPRHLFLFSSFFVSHIFFTFILCFLTERWAKSVFKTSSCVVFTYAPYGDGRNLNVCKQILKMWRLNVDECSRWVWNFYF